MTIPGYALLVVLLALAKGARHFNCGPRWLRRFTIEKSMYF
jgi:hypothetical protein